MEAFSSASSIGLTLVWTSSVAATAVSRESSLVASKRLEAAATGHSTESTMVRARSSWLLSVIHSSMSQLH